MANKQLTVATVTTADRITFTNEQVELIRSQIAPNAKPDELQLFLYQARRTGLDPLARQIYCIHRGGKMTIQTAIDGFRVIAERSGNYAGQDEPVYTDDNNGNILKCSVTVYKFSDKGLRYPAGTGVAYFQEYCAGGPMWNKMPRAMIAKCAEALALRKAYPQDLSGLYTSDEMMQADHTQGQETTQETDYSSVQGTPLTLLPNAPDPLEEGFTEAEFEAYKGEWADKLTQCKSVHSLTLFYNLHTDITAQFASIKQLFTDRKNELSPAKATAQ